MYKLAYDLVNHRLDVAFSGTYLNVDPLEVTRELRAGALKARGHGSYFDILTDFTGVSVMPQNLTFVAREEMEWCIANGLRRAANVVNSAVAKMQIHRLSGDARFQTFSSRHDALAWLQSAD